VTARDTKRRYARSLAKLLALVSLVALVRAVTAAPSAHAENNRLNDSVASSV
jgi:hypothetical protein